METFLRGTAALFLLWSVALGQASAEQSTIFCFTDGKQISVKRFETHDAKFFLYTSDSAPPLEYPVEAIKGTDERCPPPAPATDNGFGIHGSNTIGERLMPMLIEAYSRAKLGAKPTSMIAGVEEQVFTLKLANGGTKAINLQAHGSATSAPDLLGKAMIGMSSRRINAEESAAITAKFNVNPQQPGNEHVLALDGVAVIVNPANPVKELTLDQIGRIFAGKITKWADVGGANRNINVYRRDDKSGTTDTFKALVLAGPQLRFGSNLKSFESSELVASSVASDPDGIGYIGLPYVNKNRALAISATCGINASLSPFTIKTESYPLMRRLYLYTIGVPSDPVARDLIDFVLSDQAQSTMHEAGFIDQTIDFQDESDQRDMVQRVLSNPTRGLDAGEDVPREFLHGYEQIMGSVRRTSAVFRFEYNSSDLDTRAQQDIQRVARWLSSPALAGKKVFIAGFGDAKGTWQFNQELASKRASQVAQKLEDAGVRVPRDGVLALSYLAPVACNDSDSGAAKNRRVEIWIAK